MLKLLYISSTNRIVFFHIREGEADSWLSIPDSDFKVDAEVFLWGCEELDVELSQSKPTYLPIRLHAFTSPVGSGTVTVLLDRIDPVILNDFLAMVGSWLK